MSSPHRHDTVTAMDGRSATKTLLHGIRTLKSSLAYAVRVMDWNQCPMVSICLHLNSTAPRRKYRKKYHRNFLTVILCTPAGHISQNRKRYTFSRAVAGARQETVVCVDVRSADISVLYLQHCHGR